MPKKTFKRLDEGKKERVLRAAIEEFQAHGFDGAKIDNIAQKADVAKGSIYQYFDDKKALFLYSINWTLEQLMHRIDNLTPLKEMDVFDYFLSGNRERLNLALNDPLLVSYSIDFSSGKFGSLTEEINQQLKKISDSYQLALIAKGKEKGTIRQDLDDEVLLLFLQGVSDRFNKRILEIARNFTEAPTEAEIEEMQKLIEKMVGLLKHGMGES